MKAEVRGQKAETAPTARRHALVVLVLSFALLFVLLVALVAWTVGTIAKLAAAGQTAPALFYRGGWIG